MVVKPLVETVLGFIPQLLHNDFGQAVGLLAVAGVAIDLRGSLIHMPEVGIMLSGVPGDLKLLIVIIVIDICTAAIEASTGAGCTFLGLDPGQGRAHHAANAIDITKLLLVTDERIEDEGYTASIIARLLVTGVELVGAGGEGTTRPTGFDLDGFEAIDELVCHCFIARTNRHKQRQRLIVHK